MRQKTSIAPPTNDKNPGTGKPTASELHEASLKARYAELDKAVAESYAERERNAETERRYIHETLSTLASTQALLADRLLNHKEDAPTANCGMAADKPHGIVVGYNLAAAVSSQVPVNVTDLIGDLRSVANDMRYVARSIADRCGVFPDIGCPLEGQPYGPGIIGASAALLDDLRETRNLLNCIGERLG
jgi:hypothetical protein